MFSNIAEISKDALTLIQKTEKKIGESGRDIVLIAYEGQRDNSKK